MILHEMSRDECLEVLAGARLARLACAKDGQPYIVPVYVAFERPPGGEPRLYGFTTPGQKVEWMRANPLVCVEFDDVDASDRWVSIVIMGRYEELPDTIGKEGERLRAPRHPRPVATVAAMPRGASTNGSGRTMSCRPKPSGGSPDRRRTPAQRSRVGCRTSTTE